MRGVPLPVQPASGVEAFALARALGHAVPEVGLALVSAAHHVKLQSCISRTGLNWLVMHLRSLGHSVENKSDIKGSVFSPWLFSTVASFATQKSVPRSLTDRCHFFSLYSLVPFLASLWGYHKSSPCTLSPALSFLTPCLSTARQYINSSFHFLILCTAAAASTWASSCSFLLTFTHTHPWEMWIFSRRVPQEAKPLEIISRALPKRKKKCVGIVKSADH